MADQDERITLFGELHSLDVNLGDQGTSGIDDAQPAPRTVLADFGRNSMGAIDNALAVGNFIFAVDKNRALAAQLLDDKAVVDDFFADIDGRTESLQRDADHVDCPHHARAETAWFEQKQGLAVSSLQKPSRGAKLFPLILDAEPSRSLHFSDVPFSFSQY